MKKMNEYDEEFNTRNFEYVKEFVEELNDDPEVKDIEVLKTGFGWMVKWKE